MLCDAVVRERPIALRVCVIPVGAFRETHARQRVGTPTRVRRTSIRQRLSACFHVFDDGVYPVWRCA